MAPHPCCRDLAAWPEFDVVPSPDMGAQLNLAPQLGAASKEGKGGIGLGVRKEEAPQPQHHGCQEHEGWLCWSHSWGCQGWKSCHRQDVRVAVTVLRWCWRTMEKERR